MKNTPTAMRLRVSAMSVHPTPLNSISIIVAVTCGHRAVATECCVHAAFLERIRIRGGTCCSRPKADVGSAWEVRMQSNGGHAHRAAICAAGKCPKGELPPLA